MPVMVMMWEVGKPGEDVGGWYACDGDDVGGW